MVKLLLMSVDKDVVIWVISGIGTMAIAIGGFMGSSVVNVLKKILEQIELLNVNHARHDENIKSLTHRTDKHENRILKLEQKERA